MFELINMDEPLYSKDSYAKECEATVQEVKDGKFVMLDNNLFYPRGGGQPSDTGKLIRASDNAEFEVVFAGKFDGKISHEVSKEGLQPGDRLLCKLNWERRYMLMRMHTAAHALSAVIHNDTGALITGNNLEVDESRIDFNFEAFDKEKINLYVQKANEALAKDMPISVEFMQREEALKMPGMVKLASILPPSVPVLRIVSIGDLDRQADSGLHVRSTKEVGQLEVTKVQNKGKENRRVYFGLK